MKCLHFRFVHASFCEITLKQLSLTIIHYLSSNYHFKALNPFFSDPFRQSNTQITGQTTRKHSKQKKTK